MQREAWIGQLLVIGFPKVAGFEGSQIDPGMREHARYVKPGGFILFKRNVAEPATVRALSDALQGLSPDVPAFIGVDQEGGAVARFRAPFTEFPGNRAIHSAFRAEGSTAAATRQGEIFAQELRTIGMNWNFAPVLDVDTNPKNPVIGKRAYGSDPQEVATLGVAFAQAMESGGLLSCGKHVPGHGNTAVDSHLDLPREETSLAVLRERELVPFRAYAQANLTALMTAHVVYTTLDPLRPGTLSETVIQKIVRDEIGFRGLVVTDDLEMKAIDDRYGPEESAVEAVVAGNDILLICHSAEKQRAAFEAMVREDRKSATFRNRVDAALGRIEQAKKRLRTPPAFHPELIGGPEGRRLIAQLAAFQADDEKRDPTERST